MGGICDHCRQGRQGGSASVGRLAPGTRLIPVKGGPFAIIDAADYEMLSKYQWCARHTPATCYAVAHHKGTVIYMHRLIMDAPKGLLVDHIDRNGMNNQCANLRLCSHSQNMGNQGPYRGCSSKYKGIWRRASNNRFTARISFEGSRYCLGTFSDEEAAARAYDKKAKELLGEFAYLNFPEE